MRYYLKIWTVIILCISFIILIIIGLIQIDKEDMKEYRYFENCIGKKTLLNNDTLIITDYNDYNKTFNLSNGAVIKIKLINLIK